MPTATHRHLAPAGTLMSDDQIRTFVHDAYRPEDFRGQRVLVIVPDATRTCPLGTVFQALHAAIGGATAALDVMIALGTHQPMSEEAICHRLDMTRK